MGNEEAVEVVYSLNCWWQAVVLLVFGIWMGYIVGAGISVGSVEKLTASQKTEIHGDVTISNHKGLPIQISGTHIEVHETVRLYNR